MLGAADRVTRASGVDEAHDLALTLESFFRMLPGVGSLASMQARVDWALDDRLPRRTPEVR